MRIKRLHIGDFGILQNQTLEDLNSGLVVVGGHNRAGKSTFMQVLRYLGYGIPGSSALPPANVEYMVDADVLDEISGLLYHIRLQGAADPVCTVAGEGTRIPVSELYPVDSFTYRNLYTISLDQLARKPEGVTDKEMEKLQSALLGAGMTDIANIPRLENIFTRNARNIGGETGRLSNKAFKPHVQLIREGSDRKRKANAQVDEYQRRQELMQELKNRAESLGKDLEKAQARRDILETVRNNYEVIQETIDLDGSLKLHEGSRIPGSVKIENREKIVAAYENYSSQKEKLHDLFNSLALSLGSQQRAEKVKDLLFNYRNLLQGFTDRLSGLQEKWSSLQRMQDRLKQDMHELTARIKALNAGWGQEGIDRVRRLKLELLEERKIMDYASRMQDIDNKLEQARLRMDENKNKEQEIKNEIEEFEKTAPVSGLKLYFWLSLLFAAAGLVVSFFYPIAGLLFGVLGAAGVVVWAVYKGLGQKEISLRLKELRSRHASVSAACKKLQEQIDELNGERERIQSCLAEVSEKLGLPQTVTPSAVLEYYRAVSDIQKHIVRLDQEDKSVQEQAVQLAEQIEQIDKVLTELESASGISEDNGFVIQKDFMQEETWQNVKIRLKRWYDLMNTAVRLDNISRETDKVKSQILSLMGKEAERDEASLEEQVDEYLTQCKAYSDYQEMKKRLDTNMQSLMRAAASDRVTKAFSLLSSAEGQEKSPMQQLFDIYKDYAVPDSLEREYKTLLGEIDHLEQELEEVRKDIHETELLLKQLSLTEELEQAHEMILKGRSGLYQVSYEYAVQKAAAWLCREIRNEFMTRMKDELLLKADGILRRLTGEDYQRIIPNDSLSDFSFELKDGSRQENSRVLSRGTREQVFLAVRLGRIMEMQPSLPVIIDDSLVNFDWDHLKQAVQVIGDLSRTHQVFIMTCHPHLVEHFVQLERESGPPAQFWRLDQGRFFPSDGSELMEYLS